MVMPLGSILISMSSAAVAEIFTSLTLADIETLEICALSEVPMPVTLLLLDKPTTLLEFVTPTTLELVLAPTALEDAVAAMVLFDVLVLP